MVRGRRLELHSPRPTVPLLRVAAGRLLLQEITMNSVVYWALNSAKEPSTWAGLAGLAVVFGVTAEQWSMIGNAVAAVAAAIAMFVSEANAK